MNSIFEGNSARTSDLSRMRSTFGLFSTETNPAQKPTSITNEDKLSPPNSKSSNASSDFNSPDADVSIPELSVDNESGSIPEVSESVISISESCSVEEIRSAASQYCCISLGYIVAKN